MRYSIVTVTFNAAAMLPVTLESLAAQRCQDLEWLVQDGASADQSLALITAHSAATMGLRLVSEPDGGIYDAMNRAVARAQGDWIYFLNAGDALADAEVLASVAAAADASAVDLIVGEVLTVGPRVTQHRSYAHLGPTRLLFDSLCHQAVFARRSLFDRFGAFDTRFRYAADYDWLLRVWRGGARVRMLPQVVAHFATGGAHAKAATDTSRENEAVRRQHANAALLAFGRLWFHNAHRLRRACGLEALGRRSLRAPGA